MTTTTLLSKEDFCARFKARMIAVIGDREVSEDGMRTAEYADETAPTYFDQQYKEEPDSTPEDWADEDISYWE